METKDLPTVRLFSWTIRDYLIAEGCVSVARLQYFSDSL